MRPASMISALGGVMLDAPPNRHVLDQDVGVLKVADRTVKREQAAAFD
jgi:hypothetical protein